ncbi:MAG: hypothetical protein IKU62_08510 [Ruminiclostridium sp.]|nr:hypothetical protein [Ruminiclostridium sp.]
MRQIMLGEVEQTDGSGGTITCRYHLLVREIPPPVEGESYGIGVTITQTGEREEIWDITVCAHRIQSLAGLVMGGGVTPCTLRDVVDDWL